MNEAEAIATLREMYQTAPDGEMVTQIHLFGVKYAHELSGFDLYHLAERATVHRSYGTEIAKGIRLAKYVQPREDQST